jgi:hypothetical protein
MKGIEETIEPAGWKIRCAALKFFNALPILELQAKFKTRNSDENRS